MIFVYFSFIHELSFLDKRPATYWVLTHCTVNCFIITVDTSANAQLREERKKNKRIPFNKLETSSPTELDRWASGVPGGREQPPPAGQTPLQSRSMVQVENTTTSVTAIETGVAKKIVNKSLPVQT